MSTYFYIYRKLITLSSIFTFVSGGDGAFLFSPESTLGFGGSSGTLGFGGSGGAPSFFLINPESTLDLLFFTTPEFILGEMFLRSNIASPCSDDV